MVQLKDVRLRQRGSRVQMQMWGGTRSPAPCEQKPQEA